MDEDTLVSSTRNSTANDEIPDLEGTTFFFKVCEPNYFTFLCIGMGLLWPWNCILSASEYFQNDIFHGTSIWANIFTSSMMSVSTVTSLLFNLWLSKRQMAYSQRVVRGLILEILVFSLLVAVTFVHSLFPQSLNFIWIMFLVVISAIGTALTQNGILAIANVYGSEYSQAVVLGQAIAGVLPSIVLFLITFSDKPDNKGSLIGIILYFLSTSLVSLICIYLFRSNNSDRVLKDTPTSFTESESLSDNKIFVPTELLYSKLKYLVLSIFVTFSVTMVFAVFASTIVARGIPLSDKQYIPLIFTVWNVGDLCGRFIAELPFFRNDSFTAYKTFVYSLSRIALLPLFFLFLRIPKRSPILQDISYIMLQFIFGLTSGQVISMSFMKIPGALDSDVEREAAGGFSNVFVSVGLAAGSLLSYVFVFIISKMKQTV
ncbi:hypothetical protein Kpol_1040p13 [Vanderwaltozyma polyspora DSM 70294]|uniref:Nucleoside transporter FUN26 n=1 Tax=Vanderwaltozyma polyspora (strain ATCC 22028 / DSM 70294 / BCRC 21397 / CBS 2163 / NBRC 10782 / NRRL Y-8283 / UCD 57-17) TaxID=436907 RepID=A7TPK8_VANPO|nr:uncharacterized protein Kpol_1040p13 [Vanderwaltozyma polyspora DSM 70294]EDO15800.1 hypothetical protein Kpol_1040p13 [Vanderwaltozyma polyspora DSM 70294]